MEDLQKLLENNRDWARKMGERDPDFFKRLEKLQKPDFLWIGCSDSRVPANEIIGMLPGEIFVHRNVANVVAHSDINCQSVIQFAVDRLKVRHIMVVGHYGCGGVHAALDRSRSSGVVDYWLGHVRDVHGLHQHLIDAEPTDRRKESLLGELNVLEQALNVCSSAAVLDAWARGQELSVHGWIYRLGDGLLRHLDLSIDGPCDLSEMRARSVSMILAERARYSAKLRSEMPEPT
ncbi:carbonic anhydrase [Panacagrimonas perspica]|uniref:Carbonic anhydrase n=1 Tax=Panacagrimonas perspica TaxID=381431 RepID=A0A4R7PDL9_9GAMM|nr:carbonic anhydrase [Panacagrimonas perspica]TDU32275.1 carbonic anhydrase [Panacagrimonas perspica]THD05219.1 carbonic anhydrase [Panacagrimonas perspica]